jgi:hypothetical protein
MFPREARVSLIGASPIPAVQTIVRNKVNGFEVVTLYWTILLQVRKLQSNLFNGRLRTGVSGNAMSELISMDRGGRLRPYLWTSLTASILILVSSTLGIFVSGTYARYTSNLANQARAQDVVDLIAVGLLLVGTYLMTRRSVRGFQLWAGALLFLIYAFVIYAFGAPFNELFLLYVAILGLVVYTFIGGVLRLDFEKIKEVAPMSRRTRLVLGSALAILGILFYFIWLSEDVPALLNGTVPASITQAGEVVNPVHVLDMALYLPALIITGISLWRDRSLGYTLGLPLLVFSILTFVAIGFIFVL